MGAPKGIDQHITHQATARGGGGDVPVTDYLCGSPLNARSGKHS